MLARPAPAGLRMRCRLSAMFSQEPPTGVYKGMIPCANSQQTDSSILFPARLSRTRSIRSGGSSDSSVGLIERPSCHRSQAAHHPVAGSPDGAGKAGQDVGQLASSARDAGPRSGRSSRPVQADAAVLEKYVAHDLCEEGRQNLLFCCTSEAIGSYLRGDFRFHVGEERGGLIGSVGVRANRHLSTSSSPNRTGVVGSPAPFGPLLERLPNRKTAELASPSIHRGMPYRFIVHSDSRKQDHWRTGMACFPSQCAPALSPVNSAQVAPMEAVPPVIRIAPLE